MEVLKQQLTAFQEQLNRMRKAERAKDEEYRRLQDEHRSLARAQEEAKASVMKMWDQLEKKDQEVDALKTKLHGGPPPPGHMQGGPAVQAAMPRGMPPPAQMNGYPPNHPGMMQRPPHMQPPQSMPRPQPPHVRPRRSSNAGTPLRRTVRRTAEPTRALRLPAALADATSTTTTSRAVRCTSRAPRSSWSWSCRAWWSCEAACTPPGP